MKPIFKYSGGKKRESKFITSLIDNDFLRVVEPFAGSAAVSFLLEKPALIADVRKDVILTFLAVKSKKNYPKLQKRCDELSKITDVSLLEKEFYHQRDDMWGCVDELDVAWRFIVIRQLVFSGIDRINIKTGKENAPFGWYKAFKCNLSLEHHELLQLWDIRQQEFNETFSFVKNTDFVFSDPPYLDRNSMYGGEISSNDELHSKLIDCHDNCVANWMLVHCKHLKYEEFALRHKLITKEFMYAQNFKGRNNTKSKTVHFYIQNK